VSLRSALRATSLWLAQVLLSPLLLLCWIEKRMGFGEQVFTTGAQFLSLAPGAPGSLLRKAFYMATLDGCADRAYVSIGTLIAHRDAVVFPDAYIGAYCIIGSVTIGEAVNIASRVSITSGRHQHPPGAAGAPVFRRLTIGDRAWIGEGAIVMADVGADAVVGAGSVVVRDVPAGATVVGNPAREVGASGQSRVAPGPSGR
jgi:acetyltransferase-like isoleucine patch superfamily enzyme